MKYDRFLECADNNISLHGCQTFHGLNGNEIVFDFVFAYLFYVLESATVLRYEEILVSIDRN
jgi:hypothetical protein